MQTISRALGALTLSGLLVGLTACTSAPQQTPQVPAEPSPLVGQYKGVMMAHNGTASWAKLVLDRHYCFLLQIEENEGRGEIGTFSEKDGVVTLVSKDFEGERRFKVSADGKELVELTKDGAPVDYPTKGCCTVKRR